MQVFFKLIKIKNNINNKLKNNKTSNKSPYNFFKT